VFLVVYYLHLAISTVLSDNSGIIVGNGSHGWAIWR